MKVADIGSSGQVVCAGRRGYNPKISIVTPTYCRNGEGLLSRCLESATIQSFEEFEHIIIDDGSSDGSEATIKNYALRDDRIVYIRHDENSGLPGMRTNEGILRARGEAIAFLFDDNLFNPQFLELAWDALESSGADVIITQVEMLTKEGPSFKLGGWPMTLELIRNLNTIPNGGVLVRRSFFDKYGLYDPHLLLRRVCDWDLWLRALRLGAKFHFLDIVSSVEYGLVSSNSIGNTIQWDLKFVYSYMFDETRYAQRSKSLTPKEYPNFDVLDPTVFLPYLKDFNDWSKVINTFYDPFINRKAVQSTLATKSNRTKFFVPTVQFTEDNTQIKKQRVLVVCNAINGWASLWLNALRADPNFIVINCPEWNFAAFGPNDIDILILLDACSPYTPTYVTPFQNANLPIIYMLSHGTQEKNGYPNFSQRNFLNNTGIYSLFADTIYFPQANSSFSDKQRKAAGALASMATVFLGSEKEAKEFAAKVESVNLPKEYLESVKLINKSNEIPAELISFDLPLNTVKAIESITTPVAEGGTQTVDGVRRTWESLSAFLETKLDTTIMVSEEWLTHIPQYEKIAISLLAKSNNIEIITNEGQALVEEQGSNITSWIRNFVSVMCLARSLNKRLNKKIGMPKVAIFLNSQLFSGSEVYGLFLARNLHRLGVSVDIFMPEKNPYGEKAGDHINTWLKENGLENAKHASYEAGAGFLGEEEKAQKSKIAKLKSSLSQYNHDILICSGFMPVFAEVTWDKSLLFMALFQPSAYELDEIAYLSGRVAGIMSDCQWSLEVLKRSCAGVAQVVRSALQNELQEMAPREDNAKSIRIAIGGTLQPRKRQLEAIKAVGILQSKGFNIELNIYGYELELMKDYVNALQKEVSENNLTNRVRFFGLAELDEIAANNDIILSASIDESLPQTMLELMYKGVIGVGVLSGGLDELVIDNETGYLIANESENDVAMVLERAINDKARWPEIRRAARESISKLHSIEATTNDLIKILIQGAISN
jgi:glycosyltransferase involved in cell wall biosynthesis